MQAWHSIKNQKLKFLISGFGISWGVFITMMVMGFGNSANSTAKNTLDFFRNIVEWVSADETGVAYQGTPKEKKIHLTLDDARILKGRIPEILNVSPNDGLFLDIKTLDDRKIFSEVKGVINDYFEIMHFKMIKGRLFNPIDYNESRKVCLISKNMWNILFGKDVEFKLGQQLLVGIDIFSIMGIFNDPIVNTGDERVLFIPHSTYKTFYDNSGEMSSLLIDIDPEKKINLEKVNKKIRESIALKYNYKIDDYKIIQIYDTENVKTIFDDFSVGLIIFIWTIGISTLLSGIIGIVNIMFIIAKERTREIGIMKALGAKKRDIISLFLMESFLVTLISGVLGIIISSIILNLLKSNIVAMGDQFVAPSVNFETIAIYVLILGGSGIIAGIAPAITAARTNIVESLRYDL